MRISDWSSDVCSSDLWLIPRLPRFYDRHPDIDLEIVTIADPLELPPHRCDAVVTVTDGRPMPGFDIVPLVAIDAVPVCAPQLLGPKPFDLRHQRLLLIPLPPADWRRGLPPRTAARRGGK